MKSPSPRATPPDPGPALLRSPPTPGWFHSIDWDALYNLEMPPPYVPPIDNPLDLSNFDEYDNDMGYDDDEAYEAIQDEEDFWLGW